MHLARAVECPSVIVYGGREPPEISGYACNANLASRPPCAPCWNYVLCDYERVCLTAITVDEVVAAVQRLLAAPPTRPLPTQYADILPGQFAVPTP
jgi:ADP-heptose:LPS heptosyltransferase